MQVPSTQLIDGCMHRGSTQLREAKPARCLMMMAVVVVAARSGRKVTGQWEGVSGHSPHLPRMNLKNQTAKLARCLTMVAAQQKEEEAGSGREMTNT